uniref:Wall-associated receptor kinase galacturonan-binding domain-containing protein n=1 Tax=Aegilops tauschii subsp. strangulata TaxID=200361 RepID=A0A453DUV2_AEGTS
YILLQRRYPLSYTYLHRPTAKSSSVPMVTASCRFLVLVWIWWLPLTLAAGAEDQQGEGCSSLASKCGNLTISPFSIAHREAGRSCGPLDFQVGCSNNNVPFLRSSGFTGSTGFAIMDILYEDRNLRVVDVHKEEDFNVSSCHFRSSNTSSKLALPFKVNPANLNLIFYKCTKRVALVEVSCVNASNMFVHAGVRFDETGNYGDYAVEGCDAIVVPMMSSPGWANASDYEQFISHGFLLAWDETLQPATARKFTHQIIF